MTSYRIRIQPHDYLKLAIFRCIAMATLWNNLTSSVKQKTSFAKFYWATKDN